jgi:hypothetical protein
MTKPKKRTRRQEPQQDSAKIALRELECLNLRLAGYDYNTIAKNVGYQSGSAAYKAVQRAIMKTLKEPAKEVRDLELQRLDEMMTGLWLTATAGTTEIIKMRAIDSILRIMDRRAKYLGLDKEKIEVKHEGLVNINWNGPSILIQEIPPKKLSTAQKPS